LIVGWIHAWWALALLRDPDPVAQVHRHMESFLPLPVYGAFSFGCTVLYVAAELRFAKRYIALLVSCVFWSFITALFISSGASVTGQGVYLTLAMATGFHALAHPAGEHG
jgi:hypothetical protein